MPSRHRPPSSSTRPSRRGVSVAHMRSRGHAAGAAGEEPAGLAGWEEAAALAGAPLLGCGN
jgi:hypothetical protein